jgi:hypothetical protein
MQPSSERCKRNRETSEARNPNCYQRSLLSYKQENIRHKEKLQIRNHDVFLSILQLWAIYITVTFLSFYITRSAAHALVLEQATHRRRRKFSVTTE